MKYLTIKKLILVTFAVCALVFGGLALSPGYSPYGIEKPELGEQNLTVNNINWCFRKLTVAQYLETNSKRYNTQVQAAKKNMDAENKKLCAIFWSGEPDPIKVQIAVLATRLSYFSIRSETKVLLESLGSEFTKFNKYEY